MNCLFGLILCGQAIAADFELKDGDRAVFLGDALAEQEQYFGWLEVALTTAYPDRHITFRNLGWSGDTPAGQSRFGLSLLQAGREPADEGWKQLQKQLELTQPTVIFLFYGMASALEEGRDGLPKFLAEYQRLVQRAREISPGVRFVCVSPLEPMLEAKYSDASYRNLLKNTIRSYSNAIKEFANDQAFPFVDLSGVAIAEDKRRDGIHLNSAGYQDAAKAILSQLSLPSDAVSENRNLNALREVVLRKNEWWFHRSRPANMAYVFGFRKREQGQNAGEIPQFDQLIKTEEDRIAKLRKDSPVEIPVVEPEKKSKYAVFTEQPVPEFTVAEGWEVTLWAQNPDLNKPIHMNFDPQGRLWVASSEAYPMIEVGQAAPDKVIVLEDSNGDGKADQSSVFAEGLLIPTGIAPGDGGVYVAQSTDLLFLRDTDGDGKADEKTRVLNGFGTEDTHHNLHTLRWGYDGRLYMNQSVYTRTDAETPFGVARLKAGGGFRYDTRSQRMEIFFRGLWNSWGHQFDTYGQSFLTDGAGFAGIAYTFPGASFNPTPNARTQLDLISPGRWPKFASMEIIEGDSYPADWQGSIVTCDFRANRVTRFSLSEQDAGFVTKQDADLIRTSAATFRPIDVKQGPDGALYIADWSNPIINHGEVDFRDPRRDRWHGRIWRVAWKGASQKPSRQDLAQQETNTLLDLLTQRDRALRDQARRVLTERGNERGAESIIDALDDWLNDKDDVLAQLQGLWMFQSLNVANVDLLQKLLASEDHRIRAAATRVLGSWADVQSQPKVLVSVETALPLLATLVADDHPRVRLEAIRALAKLESVDAAVLAMDALDHKVDRFIDHALALTIQESEALLMQGISRGSLLAEGEEKKLELVLTRVSGTAASEFLSEKLATGPIPSDGSGAWIELIGKVGGPTELDALYGQALERKFSDEATVRAFRALANAQRLRRVRPTAKLSELGEWLQADEQTVVTSAIELAEAWRMRGLLPVLMTVVSSQDSAEQIRVRAATTLGVMGNKSMVSRMLELADSSSDTLKRTLLLSALKLDAGQAVGPLMKIQSELSNESESLQLWRAMLSVKGTGRTVASSLGQQSLPPQVLMAGIRATKDAGRKEPELQEALNAQMGGTETTTLTAAELQQIASQAVNGDPSNGELVYRRQDLACITCHAIGGVGGKVGPDMTSIGASAPIDYLVESIFQPNAKIKEGYHSVVVVTEDDQVLTGIEAESTTEELVLRTADGKTVRIPQSDVLAKKPGKSLMPLGVVDRLSRKEQIDLITFLSRLGKPGQFDASKVGVARSFKVFAGTHRKEQQYGEQIATGKVQDGWKLLNSRVNGDVPKREIEELTKPPFNISLVNVYMQATFEAASAGKVNLKTATDTAIWVDGKPVTSAGEGEFSAELSAGRHTVIVRMDARGLPETFRLESDDVTFLAE